MEPSVDWTEYQKVGAVVLPETYDLARFRTRLFQSSKAHVPPGGLGCFFADYKPQIGLMKVTVRVAPRFVDPLGQDVPLATRTLFMRSFKDNVPTMWNNKFRFTLTKKGFAGIVVKPEFEVAEAPLGDAHYDLKIVNLDRGVICVRTGEDPAVTQSSDRKWDPYRGKLSAQFSLNAWDASELIQAKNILSAMEKPVEVAVTPASGSVGFSIVTMERMRTFARDVNFIFENSKLTPKVKITGPGSTGADTAKLVGSTLERLGLKAKFSYEKNGRANMAKMELDAKQFSSYKNKVLGGVNAFPQFAQQPLVHEYGHMLGLPDEYMCASTGAVGIVGMRGLSKDTQEERDAMVNNNTSNQQSMTSGIERTQVEFIKLCHEFGTVPPPFGRSNPNIMSSGIQFQPCHGVTVAHALWRMTRNYTEMSDWKIDVA